MSGITGKQSVHALNEMHLFRFPSRGSSQPQDLTSFLMIEAVKMSILFVIETMSSMDAKHEDNAAW